jgi:hypothetical protein
MDRPTVFRVATPVAAPVIAALPPPAGIGQPHTATPLGGNSKFWRFAAQQNGQCVKIDDNEFRRLLIRVATGESPLVFPLPQERGAVLCAPCCPQANAVGRPIRSLTVCWSSRPSRRCSICPSSSSIPDGRGFSRALEGPGTLADPFVGQTGARSRGWRFRVLNSPKALRGADLAQISRNPQLQRCEAPPQLRTIEICPGSGSPRDHLASSI